MCKDSMNLERYKNLNHDEHIVPEGVSIIYSDAFHGCSDLRKIEIPEGITSIEDDAFAQSYNLKEVIIPESMTNIGKTAFYLTGPDHFILPNGKKVEKINFFEEWEKYKAKKQTKGKWEEPSKENDGDER